MFDLNDKTALITGAAQGIGLGIALELARTGCRVVIADMNLQKAQAAVEEVHRLGIDVLAVELDVTDLKSVEAGVQAALDRFARIDILVNNAGIHREKLGRLSTEEDFVRTYDVNLIGVWRVTQALAPHFKAHGGGRVVNIASINGRKPWVDTPAYSASKAALINLTQSLATTMGADNINVNAVCPGGVMTGMADAFLPDKPDIRQGLISARVLKRELLPEDIGKAVVFFASSYAANITGQALNVDGGKVMS